MGVVALTKDSFESSVVENAFVIVDFWAPWCGPCRSFAPVFDKVAADHPDIVAVTWIGFDTPRKLGDRETGGGLSLPVWIEFMQMALAGKPAASPAVPPGVVQVGGEWVFEEFAGGSGVRTLGLDDRS